MCWQQTPANAPVKLGSVGGPASSDTMLASRTWGNARPRKEKALGTRAVADVGTGQGIASKERGEGCPNSLGWQSKCLRLLRKPTCQGSGVLRDKSATAPSSMRSRKKKTKAGFP